MMPTDAIKKLIGEALDWLFKRTDFSWVTEKTRKLGLEEEKCTQKN